MIIFIYFLIIVIIIYAGFCIYSLNKFYLPKKQVIIKGKKINELFLLGTHNSLSYRINNYFSQFAKTQNLNLELQLKYGIRFFDLRFKIVDNFLQGYHAFINLNITHVDVFNIFFNFLKNNPEEFIIIVLKNEEFKNHNLIAEFLYNKYIVPNELQNSFIFNNSSWNYIPTIDEIKNKIFVLNQTINPFKNLPWADNTTFNVGSLYISDTYKDDSDTKLITYNKFINNCNPSNLNIFFSSIQFSNILGIRYNNKIILKKITINKKINQIFVCDYIEQFL